MPRRCCSLPYILHVPGATFLGGAVHLVICHLIVAVALNENLDEAIDSYGQISSTKS